MPEKIGMEATLDMAAFNRGLKQYLDGIDKMETTTAKKGSAMSTMLGGIGKIAAGVMAAGVAVGAAAIAGIGAIIKSTLPLAADFQSQLVGLELAARSSGLGFDELHDAALQVGGDTRLLGVSATGAADAMTGLFKAGLSVTEIFGDVNAYMEEGAELGGALRAAIDLAAATELDMVQASELAAISLATFGGELETEEERANFVAIALDNLVRAADASVAEVTDLAAALTMVGPGAVALGYSIEDVNTALAILSTAGITGTRAGTALDGMLRTLLSPGKEAADTIAGLGIELYDLDGSFRALPDIIGQFSKALTVGGQTSKKVSLLTADQRKELAKLQKQHATATKKLEEYHKGLRGTTQTEKTRLKAMAKLEEQINILNIDMGPLTDKAEQYTTVTREMTEAQRNQAIGTIFTAQGQRAMNVLLGEGVEGWEGMTAAMEEATGIQEQAAARAATFTGRMEALQGQIETLKIGIGEAFLPVAESLIDVFSKFIEDYGPALTEVFKELGEWLAEKLPLAIVKTDEILEGLGLDLVTTTQVWDEETGKWVTSIEAVEDPLKRLHDFIDVAMKEAMAGLAIASTVAFIALSGPAFVAAASIIAAWSPVIIPILAVVAAAYLLKRAWDRLQEAIARDEVDVVALEALGLMFPELTRAIEETTKAWEFWSDKWPEVSAIVVETTEEIETEVAAFVAEVGRMFEEFGTGFLEFWGETWDTISTKASEIWVAIKTTVGEAMEGIGTEIVSRYEEIKASITAPLADAWQAIKDTIEDWKTLGKDLIGGIVEGIKAKAQGVIDAITTAVKAAIRIAKIVIEAFSPSRVFMDIGASMMEGLALGVAETAAIPIAVTSEVMHRIEELFAMGRVFGGLAGGAVRMLEARGFARLREELRAIDEQITEIEERKRPWAFLVELENLQRRRADVTEEIARNEANILALQERQMELGFLQQQIELLKLIEDYDLNLQDILGGMVLGIEANAGDVLAAMVRAMQEVITVVEEELGVRSPSRIFIEMGKSMMEGLALGVAKAAAIPVAVTSEVMHRVSAPALFQRPAMTMPATSSSTVNVNMGGVSIYDQMSEAVFEAQVRQIVTSAVGG